MIARMCTATGWSRREVCSLTLWDVRDLQAEWDTTLPLGLSMSQVAGMLRQFFGVEESRAQTVPDRQEPSSGSAREQAERFKRAFEGAFGGGG